MDKTAGGTTGTTCSPTDIGSVEKGAVGDCVAVDVKHCRVQLAGRGRGSVVGSSWRAGEVCSGHWAVHNGLTNECRHAEEMME